MSDRELESHFQLRQNPWQNMRRAMICTSTPQVHTTPAIHKTNRISLLKTSLL